MLGVCRLLHKLSRQRGVHTSDRFFTLHMDHCKARPSDFREFPKETRTVRKQRVLGLKHKLFTGLPSLTEEPQIPIFGWFWHLGVGGP